MTDTEKSDPDFLYAQLSDVKQTIAELTPRDFVMRASLERHKRELEAELEADWDAWDKQIKDDIVRLGEEEWQRRLMSLDGVNRNR